MKRTKTVFTSREIAHVWANQSASFGRCPSSMSFDGDAFKSYATVIARRIRARGKVAYVLDRASFSNSTSKHQSHVWRALAGSDKAFHVRIGHRCQSLSFTPATLRDYYIAQFRANDEAPSRYTHVRASSLLSRVSHLESAIDVCSYFGLGHKALDKTLAGLAEQVTEARQVSEAYETKRKAKREARWGEARIARDTADARQLSNAIALAERLAKGGESEETVTDALNRRAFGYDDCLLESRPDLKEAIATLREREAELAKGRAERDMARWIAGEKDVNAPYSLPIALRADGDEMETSHGARVPLDSARRTYLFARKVKALGWHRNGTTHQVGMYQLEAVNDTGIVAGCHRIAWTEIERFARVQGWEESAGATV
jgi:hypothetical protein